jgi:hypothetical protein
MPGSHALLHLQLLLLLQTVHPLLPLAHALLRNHLHQAHALVAVLRTQPVLDLLRLRLHLHAVALQPHQLARELTSQLLELGPRRLHAQRLLRREVRLEAL